MWRHQHPLARQRIPPAVWRVRFLANGHWFGYFFFWSEIAWQAAEKSSSSGGRCFSADVNRVLSMGFSP
jgi:hypothetical protein